MITDISGTLNFLHTMSLFRPLISFFPTLLSAEKHEPEYNHHAYYDIIRNNKIIGYMKCSKLGNTETTEYINESSAKFSAIIDIAVYSKLQLIRNGILKMETYQVGEW